MWTRIENAYANNWMTGNGTSDFRFLNVDYSSVNTIPDVTLGPLTFTDVERNPFSNEQHCIIRQRLLSLCVSRQLEWGFERRFV